MFKKAIFYWNGSLVGLGHHLSVLKTQLKNTYLSKGADGHQLFSSYCMTPLHLPNAFYFQNTGNIQVCSIEEKIDPEILPTTAYSQTSLGESGEQETLVKTLRGKSWKGQLRNTLTINASFVGRVFNPAVEKFLAILRWTSLI